MIIHRIYCYCVNLLITHNYFIFNFTTSCIPDTDSPIIRDTCKNRLINRFSILNFAIILKFIRIMLNIWPKSNCTFMVTADETILCPLKPESSIKDMPIEESFRELSSSFKDSNGSIINTHCNEIRVGL